MQINTSRSLRCLLEEVVEWQKLGISVQIHSLLKTYIADAQAKQLSNQMANSIAEANLNWARQGIQVTQGGTVTTEPIYVVNQTQSLNNRLSRELTNTVDQAGNDPALAATYPQGSLNICGNTRFDTAVSIQDTENRQVENSYTDASNYTSCSISGNAAGPLQTDASMDTYFDNPTASDIYDSAGGAKTGLGSFYTMFKMTEEPQNSPIGAQSAVEAVAYNRLYTAQNNFEHPIDINKTETCSGNEADPNCVGAFRVDTSPAVVNAALLTRLAGQGDQQIQDNSALDTVPSKEAQYESQRISQNGIYGYDPTELGNSQNAVNSLIQELYNAISVGYFGIDSNPDLNGGGTPTTDWAQGTMLMIYDEMKFSDQATIKQPDKSLQVDVPNSANSDQTSGPPVPVYF